MRLALILVVLACWVGAVAAQPPPPTEGPEDVFEAGVRAMERQDWVAAELLFRQALEADPSPRVRFNLAEALFEQDELAAARSEAEAVAEGPDLLLRDAALNLIQRIEARLARLTVRVEGVDPDAVEVYVDGERVSAGSPVVLDPGEHAVALRDGDRVLDEATVTLRRGQAREETLRLDLSPEAAAELGGAEEPTLLGGPEARRKRRRRLALGITAALLVVGAVALGVGLGVRGNDDPSGDVDAIVFELAR